MEIFEKLAHYIEKKKSSRSASILKQSRRYFNRQAATYNFVEPSLCYQPVLDMIKKIPGNIRLLDVGCGNGIMLSKIVEELDNVERITGVDISSKMVEEAKNRLSSYKCCIVEGTMETVKLRKNFYNIVLCMHSFHHYPTPLTTMKNIYKVMKKGGIFILVDNRERELKRWVSNWRLRQQGYPCGDMWIYSKMELLILAKLADFTVEDYQTAGTGSFIMIFKKN
ncbi:MAG: class I SAM-dependent methyltransferase [Ruminococcus flavefaciens]|nr:class I SAM-dependent methyltransferase [Ruminococcus flavefaciens]